MTVAVSNTNLTDSFNSWRLNTNLAATVISNNAVTVYRAGSSARGKAVTGNTHVKGTLSAVELRTDTIKGGNAAMGTAGKSGAIIIASNTSVTGTTLTVSSDTTFTGNVDFETAGVDRVNLGSIDRVIVSGGGVGQFLRIAGPATDNPQFKALTLRDITDLSSNSAHLILSGANTTFSSGAKDSPHLIFAGGSNSGADRFHLFAGDNATAGDDDLIIQLTDNVGDSNININNAANTNMATISSRGLISANGITLSGTGTFNGDVILGNATADTITMKGNFANQHTEGTATFTKLGVQTATVATGVDLEVARSMKIGKNIQVVGNSVFDTNVTVTGTLLVPGGISGVGATAAYETLNITGNSTLGNATSDTITMTGTVQGLTTVGDISLTSPAKIRVTGGNTIVGTNGKLHANNAITNSTIKGIMLENSGVTAATYGSASAFPIVTVDAQGLVTTVTTSALNNATASVKGIASFSTDNFLVSSGVVTVKDNGIILGTETTGAYVSTLTGTANEVNVSGSGSETATVTVGLPDDVTITQDLTVGRHLLMGDNDTIKLGAGEDLKIYHDASNSYILENGTGDLVIASNNGANVKIQGSAETLAIFADDGAVTLYYNNGVKLATKADGVDITGELQSDTLDVDGNADISGTLTAGNITVTGTLAGAIEADTVIAAADSSDTQAYIAFFNAATGAQAMKTDTGLTYNASTNALTTTTFVGALTGNVTGNASGTAATVTTAAQPAITSLGTLTALTTGSVNSTGLTQSATLNVTGISSFGGNTTHPDSVNSYWGSDNDLQIYHSGSHGYIINNAGNLNIRDDGGGGVDIMYATEYMARFTPDGAATLYHNAIAKLATTSTGVSVTGTMSASGVVSGSQFNGAWQYMPAGTVMVFHQTAAPTGWTKVTSHNNKAFRVVSGSVTTGGSVPFTTAFASQGVAGSINNVTATGSVSGSVGNTTLTTAQMPSHTHTTNGRNNGSANKGDSGGGVTANEPILGGVISANATGGGQSHNHTWSGTIAVAAHNHTFTGTAINLAVQYVDLILATKN